MITCAIPRIVIAGTGSGCGKTTVASGLIAALTERGLTVQAFKVGPDFIDPSHHRASSKRPARNLDPFMMGEAGVIKTFAHASKGADIAVIEGVMGLFDGVDGSDFASTAHVARILDAPIILVANVRGMSRSVHAVVHGFQTFDPSIRVEGLICTFGGSQRHESMVKNNLHIPCYGWIPRSPDLFVESRHLGLVMAAEDMRMQQYGSMMEECCDISELIICAEHTSSLLAPSPDPDISPRVRLGIALDDAFCFYYEDNFTLLRQCGVEFVFFSPLSDTLPDADAYYFGGGYPELHMEKLTKSPCIDSLKQQANNGKVVLGECGGLMWLSNSITVDEETQTMAGLLPASSEMEKQFVGLGYAQGEVTGGDLFQRGCVIKGHEYHYSRTKLECDADARFSFTMSRGKGIQDGKDGLYVDNVLGYYTHMYLTPDLANSLIAAIEQTIK